MTFDQKQNSWLQIQATGDVDLGVDTVCMIKMRKNIKSGMSFCTPLSCTELSEPSDDLVARLYNEF